MCDVFYCKYNFTFKVDKVKMKQNFLQSDKKIYSLTAVVCHINDPAAPDKRNLVALINVPQSYTSGTPDKEHRWYLFNDFSICPVPAQEAVWFSLDWKIPCVLYYATSEVTNGVTEILSAITKVITLY